MEELKKALIKEAKSEVEMLDELDVETDAYENTVEGVTSLTDRIIKMEELEQKAEFEKEKENSSKKQFIITTVVGVGTFIAGVVLDVALANKFTAFEDEHILNGSAAKSFVNKIFRKR